MCSREFARMASLTIVSHGMLLQMFLSDPYYVGNVLTKSGSEVRLLRFYTILLVGEDGRTKGIITSAIESSSPDDND